MSSSLKGIDIPIHIKKDGRAGRRIKRVYPRICPNCGTNFLGIKTQIFCTESCKGEHKYVSKITTTSQYERISGNWKKYLQRLLYAGGKKRENLLVEDLLEILEAQNYRCALSGMELTCKLEVGKDFKTNVSVDRIDAGGPYIKENIQLVCKALNSFRRDTNLKEFIWWCKKVSEFNEE